MATITLLPDKIGKTGLTGTIVYAGTYFCTCGAKVNYQDENGKPKRLPKCVKCEWGRSDERGPKSKI